jgi:hypothetical protein
MTSQNENRATRIIEAYFTFPRREYAQMVEEVRMNGGLTPSEVRTLKDRLLFIHSDTIIRHAGLSEPGRALPGVAPTLT